MLSRYLLWASFAAHSVFSLAVPFAQAPLLSIPPVPQAAPRPSQITPNRKNVAIILAFMRRGEDHEQTIQLSPGQPLVGSMLHIDPFSNTIRPVSSLKILSVLDASSLDGLDEERSEVRCRIAPRFDEEERRSAAAAHREIDVWPTLPTFGAEDGIVILDRAESRWFLAGRRVESVECW